MSRPIFKSDRSAFNNRNESFIDMALGRAAMIVEIALKTTAGMPVSNTKASGNKRGGGGHMKSETRFFKNQRGNWRTEVDKEYAAAQEAGIINGHPVKNYSTPGTSAHFFLRAIDTMVRQSESIIAETRRALKL